MPKGKKWTDEEEAFLFEHAPDMTPPELEEALNKSVAVTTRTCAAISRKCKVLGIKWRYAQRGPWSQEDIQFLKDNHEKLGIHGVALALKRDSISIREMLETGQLESEKRVTCRKQVTPWMDTMLVTIPKIGKTIYDLSQELYKEGRKIEIRKKHGKFAIFETTGVF
jgi:hypothetical protein